MKTKIEEIKKELNEIFEEQRATADFLSKTKNITHLSAFTEKYQYLASRETVLKQHLQLLTK